MSYPKNNNGKDPQRAKPVFEQIQLIWPYDDVYYVVCRMEPWAYRKLLRLIYEGLGKKEAITAMVISGEGVSLFITKRNPKQLAEDGLKDFDSVSSSRFLDDVEEIQKKHSAPKGEPFETNEEK